MKEKLVVSHRYSVEWEAPMMSEKCNSHLLMGKSLGCVLSDHKPSNVTSYLASSQAQQGSLIKSCFRCSSILASHNSKLSLPESMAQTSLQWMHGWKQSSPLLVKTKLAGLLLYRKMGHVTNSSEMKWIEPLILINSVCELVSIATRIPLDALHARFWFM